MWRYLTIGLLLIALLEVFLVIQVGQEIGAAWTIAALVVTSAIGAWIVRREGLRAWSSLRDAITTGHVPRHELADAGLILLGGALLLTPGFATDAAGFLVVLPLTRPLARKLLLWYVGRHTAQAFAGRTGEPQTVRGEVIDGDR